MLRLHVRSLTLTLRPTMLRRRVRSLTLPLRRPSSSAAMVSVADALRAIPPNSVPSASYDALVSRGVLRPDAYQRAVLPSLDRLHAGVVTSVSARPPQRGGLLSLFSAQPPVASRPRGLYLHGGTGCGKTFLMDLFVACAPPAARARRVHFHAFMRDVNARLHAARSRGARGDLLTVVGRELVADAWLLCFDEVQVTDVGDALILRRLFDELHAGGLVMFGTSNRAPGDLYAGGLQRELFLPFVDALRERADVLELASPTDHRLLASHDGVAADEASWIAPARRLDDIDRERSRTAIAAALDRAWVRARAGAAEEATSVAVPGAGRAIPVTRAVRSARLARFTFDELCRAPLYAGDYAAIARAYSHVFVDALPRLGMAERNELRRLITLIDVLYDCRVRLTVSAEAAPEEIFSVDDGAGTAGAGAGAGDALRKKAKTQYDEVFAWDRAVSRLLEMGSVEYRANAAAWVGDSDKSEKE